MKNFIKKKSLFGFILLLLAIGVTNAQMGIGTDEPDASALLDIKASDKGLLIPRMDLGNLTSNTSPVNRPTESLLVYNTDEANRKANAGFYYWDGGAWIPISNPGAIGKDGGSTNNSITGFTSGNKAFLSELDLGVNVDDATIKIDTDTTINADGTVSITGTGELYVNLKAGGGLFSDASGLSVNLGDGGAEGTGTGENDINRGAGQNVTSGDNSITVTKGFGAAFTEMGLKVKVDNETIKINDDPDTAATNPSDPDIPSPNKGKLYVNVDDATIKVLPDDILDPNNSNVLRTKGELYVNVDNKTIKISDSNAIDTADLNNPNPGNTGGTVGQLYVNLKADGGLVKDATGALSVDIVGDEGIGKDVSSIDGSIYSGLVAGATENDSQVKGIPTDNKALLKALNLQVSVDSKTIKVSDTDAITEVSINNPNPGNLGGMLGELYVDAAYSNNAEKLTIRKWFGGRDIFEIVKTVITTTSSTQLTIIGGITDLTQVLNIRIIADAVTGGANANAGGVHHSGKYTTKEGNAVITVGSGKMSSKLPAGTYFIIIEYLK